MKSAIDHILSKPESTWTASDWQQVIEWHDRKDRWGRRYLLYPMLALFAVSTAINAYIILSGAYLQW